MRARSREREMLDETGIPEEEIRVSLDFMSRVNRRLGGSAVVLDYFRAHAPAKPITVLDLGTGCGDIPHTLVRWARSQSRDISVTALDTNPNCIAYARRHYPSDAIRYLEHSAFRIEELGEFDYIISSMFFHHLDDEEIVALLKTVDRRARRGFIVNDLYRGWIPYVGVLMLAAASGRKIVVSDAPLSVKRGFREQDFHKYSTEAGLKNARVERKPFYRISLACVK